MSSKQIALSLCTLPLLMFAIGCGQGGATVRGKVQFEDGSPLTQGELIFDSGTYSEIAPIDDQGNFTIAKGLPDGNYKIIVQGASEGDYTAPKMLIDKRYIDYRSTDLELNVEGSASDIVLTVDRPKKK
ncbi:hypothetical protein [Blastopirellula marina]|uniref:Carboxypeptidase regulatory-like domain-containing protein n=1 Tax=Blastopirellula marina DSM 3645 TaxID=314230 RepID=A3ZWA4_9BACT|nr:hypothetical protein [Blastopirellula marina]EAQ79128.1 hypothetical protein DSM3645_25934 [Blastopirellula marina DSM 3645]